MRRNVPPYARNSTMLAATSKQALEKMSGLDAEDKEAQSRLQVMRDTYAALEGVGGQGARQRRRTRSRARKPSQMYLAETRPLVEQAFEAAMGLVETHTGDVMDSAEETRARYASAKKLIYAVLGVAMLLGLGLAIYLARGIVRPLNEAMSVAAAIRDGKLNNSIETGGQDETGKLLGSLDAHAERAARARSRRTRIHAARSPRSAAPRQSSNSTWTASCAR